MPPIPSSPLPPPPLNSTCTLPPLQTLPSTLRPSWSSSLWGSRKSLPVSTFISYTFPSLSSIHSVTDYIAETTIGAVDTALGYRSTAWNRASLGGKRVPFKRFVWDVIRRASVKTPVLLTTLVYITRARPHLHIETEDWACERVFLGALMVASKVCPSLSLVEPPAF